MKRLPLVALVALFPLAAAAQQATGARAEFEASTGPVTVQSVQPALPNASDYQVQVSDLDTNGDGVISRREVPESHALASEFRLVDRNGDGRITAEELAAWK